jgi:pyruvate formate lyase activating enzyme
VFLRKTSLVDYPGKVAAVVFFPFCNLRCPWCQNGALISGGAGDGSVALEAAVAHIQKRRRVLGGVVLSGGEPALFAGLASLICRIKGLGLCVKLDTNGLFPDVLAALLSGSSAPGSRPDYIACDLKVSPDRYSGLSPLAVAPQAFEPGEAMLTPVPAPLAPERAALAVAPAVVNPPPSDYAELLRRSARIIRESGVPHEFRSLALPADYFGSADVAALGPLAHGSRWVFRPFVPGNCLDGSWNARPPGDAAQMQRLADGAECDNNED